MYEAAASCKDIARSLVTNWESQCATLAGYCHAVKHGMKVQLVTPYHVSHLQRYGFTVRGNVTLIFLRVSTDEDSSTSQPSTVSAEIRDTLQYIYASPNEGNTF
jgi:hypothetical protein